MATESPLESLSAHAHADKPAAMPIVSNRAIGSILVADGRLAASHLEEIRRHAATRKVRFGEAALELKLITAEDIEFALARQFDYPILARGGAFGVSDEVVAAYEPHSPLVERLRGIRSQLMLLPRNEIGSQALAIVSASRGEGRSLFAANLATVFAQTGSRTLLIDADLRHGRQQALFKLPTEAGLSALLTGRCGMEAVRQIHPDLELHVLSAGGVAPNPQELLSRPAFEALLARATEDYDVVIIDTPALTESADAQVIAARAGMALVLARRNYSRHRLLRAASASLAQTGVNVVGSVINDY